MRIHRNDELSGGARLIDPGDRALFSISSIAHSESVLDLF